jgi:hypothetical protein
MSPGMNFLGFMLIYKVFVIIFITCLFPITG